MRPSTAVVGKDLLLKPPAQPVCEDLMMSPPPSGQTPASSQSSNIGSGNHWEEAKTPPSAHRVAASQTSPDLPLV